MNFIPRIESLRGLAALTVVGYHAWGHFSDNPVSGWDAVAFQVLKGLTNGIGGCSDFLQGTGPLVASTSRGSHGRRQTPQNMERGGLFQNLILERHAFRIVLLEPLFRGVHTCEYLDVVFLADLLARVDINENGH